MTREEYVSLQRQSIKSDSAEWRCIPYDINGVNGEDLVVARDCYPEVTKIVYDIPESHIRDFCLKHGIDDAVKEMLRVNDCSSASETAVPEAFEIDYSKCQVREVINFITSIIEIKFVISMTSHLSCSVAPPQGEIPLAPVSLDVLSTREAINYECILDDAKLARELVGNASVRFRIIRYILRALQTDIRFAIEEKRYSHMVNYAFHIEQERDAISNSEYFVRALYNCSLYTTRVLRLLYFRRFYNYIDLTDIFGILENLNLRRNYRESTAPITNIVGKSVKYVSWKLDGTRGVSIITPRDVIIISPNSGAFYVFPHSLVLGFYYIGHVEILSDTAHVLIDIVYRLTLDNEHAYRYEKLSIIESIVFMGKLARDSPRRECENCDSFRDSLALLVRTPERYNLYVNTYTPRSRLSHNNEPFAIANICRCFPTDGLLTYEDNQITKYKSINSIDLRFNLTDWLACIYNMEKLPKKRYRAIVSGIQPITLDIVRPWIDRLNLAPSSLLYYDPSSRDASTNGEAAGGYVNFLEGLGQDYYVNWKPRISDFIINPEYQRQYAMIVETTNTTPDAANCVLPFRPIECLLRMSLTIEFAVNRSNKQLDFIRIRHKPNCNTAEYIRKIV